MKDVIRLTAEPLNIAEAVDNVCDRSCGGIATFIGTTREDPGEGDAVVVYLEYEAYEAMADREMRKICSELRTRWPAIANIAMFHRLGKVAVAEASIVIAVSTPRRKDALDAVSAGIELLKARVPIWKKEIYTTGESQWMANKECAWSYSGARSPTEQSAPTGRVG